MVHIKNFFIIMIPVILAQNDIDRPSFRIIAPQIICPKDKEAIIHKSDTTTVMVQTRFGLHMTMQWAVRWTPLVAPSQRFTLLIWRSVRNLEQALNQPQPVPLVYVIDNNELLPDVNYVFNVTGLVSDEVIGQKSFHINNISGKRKLEQIDGEADKFSLVLLGSEIAYSNIDYELIALVTMCRPTQDYYFVWTIEDVNSHDAVANSDIGSRLIIPAGILLPDHIYSIECEVRRGSDQMFINEMQLTLQVLRRQLDAAMNQDSLVISTNTEFDIEVAVFDQDYLLPSFQFKWWCKNYDGEPCDFIENHDNKWNLISGISTVGLYEIGVTISAGNHSTTTINMTIQAIEPRLPVLQVVPIRRILNEGSRVALVGNASNIAPACSLTWYFAESLSHFNNETCENCEHGEQLIDTLTIHSLEENFLNELADFTNETEWRQVTAEITATSGRARFLAECGCSLTFSCETAGFVYADVFLELNKRPITGDVTVSPSSGVALGTIFRIRTQAAQDLQPPLKYSFFTGLGVDMNLLLDMYLEHLVVETFLPYKDGTNDVWVEVCDSLGACTQSEVTKVDVAPASGDSTASTLLETARAHLRRCELLELQRVSISVLVTLKNSGLTEELSAFSSELNDLLAEGPSDPCLQNQSKQYSALLEALAYTGFDISALGS